MIADLRTGIYDLLSLGFRRPTPGQVERLSSGGTRQLLVDLDDVLPVPWSTLGDQFDRFCEDVPSRGAGSVAEQLLVEYCRLFLGPGALPCPPYGSVYLDGSVMGPSTLDVVRRYRDEGLGAVASWKEPPDHIAVELGFMAWLSAATNASDDGAADRLLRVQAEFLRDHLGRWGPLLAQRLGQATSWHLYRFLGGLLPAWLSFDGELLRAVMAEMRMEGRCG